MNARHTALWLPVDGEYVRSGDLYANSSRHGLSVSFRYSDEYLGRPGAYSFDPLLSLGGGNQQHPAGGFAGALNDAQPDRWGRRLIARDRRARGVTQPDELDFLLGITDELRMGALRFTEPEGGPFLASSEGKNVPPLTDLAHLARLSERAESDPAFRELRELADAGSSLGGARPKVNVLGAGGSLSIAKFTSVEDDYSAIAWEFVALEMAERVGADVPKHDLLWIGGRPVLVVERFDRTGSNNPADDRVPYVSAMTLLGLTDGSSSSYVEIAEELVEDSDRQELFRRATLGLLIGNTDDHLRNHGLLWGGGEWRLSPVFDINPGFQKHEHATVISPFGEDGVTTLKESAGLFGLTSEEADDVILQAVDAVSEWRSIARSAGIPQSEINSFASVFENDHTDDAMTLS